MTSESCGNALVIIENQENLGFGTWEKPGNKPGKKPGNKPGKNLVKTRYFPGQPGKPGNDQALPSRQPGQ